jgi:hypothetical protein
MRDEEEQAEGQPQGMVYIRLEGGPGHGYEYSTDEPPAFVGGRTRTYRFVEV